MRYIYQKDFNNGTLRLINSGSYQLMENIVFHPNPNNNFLPRFDQKEYPLSNGYILGFFAAITIEGEDIELNLNGKRIDFSKEFNLKQRFGAIIELGSSPFIPKQGPADFGSQFKSCKNICIKNGFLGNSSHHGIHGNNPSYVQLKNLVIEDFEVSGISINGGEGIEIVDVVVQNNHEVKNLSSYSQAKFCLPTLEKIVSNNKTSQLITHYGTLSGQDIMNNLKKEITDFENHVLNNGHYNGLFLNPSGLTDANVYGISLNSKGVLINDFKKEIDEKTPNRKHMISNVNIRNIKSLPVESRVLALEDKSVSNYGKKVCKGPFGDVIDFDLCTDQNGFYDGNVLSNAQLFVNKYGSKKEKGSCNIPDMMYKWINTKVSIDDVVNKHKDKIYWVEGFDSMAHKMKGNIGLFISQGKDIHMENILIEDIMNLGTEKNVESSQCCGILITGSNLVSQNNIKIFNIKSAMGNHYDQLLI